jgi:uncharacterized protein (DUF1015 family)
MPKVLPFNGLLYNREKIAGDEVIAPPYDVISPEQKDALYEKSPYNIVRVDFGKELPGDSDKENRYTRAGALLDRWMGEGILVRDDKPAFYAYEIDYTIGGRRMALRGVFSLVEIVELGSGVFPHEQTKPKAKADRLDIMRHCMGNLSPIYAIYNSTERVTSRILESPGEPYLTAHDADGAVHRLYRIDDPARTHQVSAELSGRPLFIADGHHRYEVALEFKREMDAKTNRADTAPKPWDYALMFLANTEDEGLTILPTHRMVKGLAERAVVFEKLDADFDIAELPSGADLSAVISGMGRGAFGFYSGAEKKWYTLKYRGGRLNDQHEFLRDLDVVILQERIINRDLGVTDVAYEMSVDVAVGRVHAGEFDAVFFLNPTGVDDLERVAGAGLRMPPKSTYFYPKLLTGMVINKF